MPKRVDRAARREEILAVAAAVFARKGFAASRIEDVAAEAGIAKGAVYLYFDSRDELLTSVLAAFAAEIATTLTSLGEGSALQRLDRLVHSMINSAATKPDQARVMLDLWSVTPRVDDWSDSPMGNMTAVYRQYRETVVNLLREAREAGEARADVGDYYAVVVVGAIEGCLLQWLIDPTIPLAELAAPIVSMCINGIRS